MQLVFEALKRTGGKANGDAIIAIISAMRGMAWASPRGLMEIDSLTRDVVRNEYIRVDRVNGQLWNVEYETYSMVNDPAREAKK
jgi:branched-chain amino acid transport system substrate-binding protein